MLPNPFEFWIIASIGLLSILGVVGNYFVNESIVHGKAGPTSALCEVQSLWLLALEIIFLKKVPSPLQIVGFAMGIIGGGLIAFGPEAANATH